MQALCKNNFLMNLYRKIDGAVLWSQNERNLECVVTFQTHSILQRFMLRFDFLQLDCNDHLYIYDGAHAVGSYKVRDSTWIYYIKLKVQIPLYFDPSVIPTFALRRNHNENHYIANGSDPRYVTMDRNNVLETTLTKCVIGRPETEALNLESCGNSQFSVAFIPHNDSISLQ